MAPLPRLARDRRAAGAATRIFGSPGLARQTAKLACLLVVTACAGRGAPGDAPPTAGSTHLASRTGCATGDTVSYYAAIDHLVVCNFRYAAMISRETGELTLIRERNARGELGDTLLSGDHLLLRTGESGEPVNTSDLVASEIQVEESYDFYLKLATVSYVPTFSGRRLRLRRTYEFTGSPNVYEQIALAAVDSDRNEAPAVTIVELTWSFESTGRALDIATTTDDLRIRPPALPLGGLDRHLPGRATRTSFVPGQARPIRLSRNIIAQTHESTDWQSVRLDETEVLLANSIIAARPEGSRPIPRSIFDARVFQFYPDYGLRAPAFPGSGPGDGGYTFSNWNRYALADGLIPIDAQTEPVRGFRKDLLIRLAMHLRRRMELDQWWPKLGEWRSAARYPRGDIFTANARAFPFMAYVWGYLTLRRENGRWVHEPGDADNLYAALQSLYRHYIPGNHPNFHDLSRPQGIPYLSYSAARKEKTGDGPRGVLNTHAHALHLAWLMRGISRLHGDTVMERRWREVVKMYHAGSKALFHRLYPARRAAATYPGIVQYSVGSQKMESHYNTISLEGIAAGYLQEEDYELEFVDAVERAVQDDYAPLEPGHQQAAAEPFVARLCRVLPVALTVAGDEMRMSGSIAAASLAETLMFSQLLADPSTARSARRRHDPDRFIVEKAGRKWILTSASFVSDWVPGFWEEAALGTVPSRMGFGADIDLPDEPGARWTVSRSGDRLLVLTNVEAPRVSIRFPVRHLTYTVHYRDYHENQWGPPRLVDSGERWLDERATGDSVSVDFPEPLDAKTLAIVEIASNDYPPRAPQRERLR